MIDRYIPSRVSDNRKHVDRVFRIRSLLPYLLALALAAACSKTDFSSSSSANKGRGTKPKSIHDAGKDADDGESDVDVDGRGGDDDLDTSVPAGYTGSIVRDVDTAVFESFWTVTMSGVITYYKLRGKTIELQKRWTFSIPTNGMGGARTYVTEGGLVFAKPRGHLYWVDPDRTPEGPLPEETGHRYYKELDEEGATQGRSCVVSYKRGNTRYLGAGFGLGAFIEIKLADKAPHEPIWSDYTIMRPATPSSEWGYSCYIDQKNMIYYSKLAGQQPNAFDLKNAIEVKPAVGVAPNAAFVTANNDLKRFMFDGSTGGSYALSGGLEGQVFNISGAYTFTDDKHGFVWGAFFGGSSFLLSKIDCLTKDIACVRGKDFLEQPGNPVQVGPLSALKSGNVIGLQRGSGDIHYMSLIDRSDLSKGIEVTKIGKTEGDPYMYTDFTGSTLYDSKFQDYRITLSQSSKFEPSTTVEKIRLKTIPHKGETLDWSGYKFMVRCVNNDGVTPPDFAELEDPAATLEGAVLKTKQCQDTRFDEVQIRIAQVGSGSKPLMIKAFKIIFAQ